MTYVALKLPEPLFHRVRHMYVIKHLFHTVISNPHYLLLYNLAGNPDNDGVVRDLVQNHGIGPYLSIIAYPDGTEYLCPSPHHHPFSECGMALAFLLSCPPECNTLIQEAVLTNLCRLPYHDPHPMVYKKPRTYPCPRVYLNPGHQPDNIGYKPGQDGNLFLPQYMVYSVEKDCMKPGIAEHDIQPAACCRVPLKDRLKISLYII
ncbi:hypothetical protein BMS3Bbin07_00675 [bacterium BMS3Bbin07]|nr:hypothetical protein BMS3Bbin07_00675 [bacterium BMS3Bbin07]